MSPRVLLLSLIFNLVPLSSHAYWPEIGSLLKFKDTHTFSNDAFPRKDCIKKESGIIFFGSNICHFCAPKDLRGSLEIPKDAYFVVTAQGPFEDRTSEWNQLRGVFRVKVDSHLNQKLEKHLFNLSCEDQSITPLEDFFEASNDQSVSVPFDSSQQSNHNLQSKQGDSSRSSLRLEKHPKDSLKAK